MDAIPLPARIFIVTNLDRQLVSPTLDNKTQWSSTVRKDVEAEMRMSVQHLYVLLSDIPANFW